MKGKYYAISTIILFVVSFLLTMINGISLRHFIDSLFLVSLGLFCLSLLLLIFSDGAFSIMGHSFRRFSYVMAPKRVKETMDEDELYQQKEVIIRQERYSITLPLLIVSLVGCIVSLVISLLF